MMGSVVSLGCQDGDTGRGRDAGPDGAVSAGIVLFHLFHMSDTSVGLAALPDIPGELADQQSTLATVEQLPRPQVAGSGRMSG